MIGQAYLTSRDMREVEMQTEEPVSTCKSTERLMKILDSTYAKADLKQVAYNTTQLDSEYRTQLLTLLNDFEGLFDGTLVQWDI